MERDPLIGIPIPHLSFILKHFLPMQYNCKSRQELRDKLALEWLTTGELIEGTDILASGSTMEGLDVPAQIHGMYTKPVGEKTLKWADVDLMLVFSKRVLADPVSRESNQTGEKEVLDIYTEGVHPGYLQLRKPEIQPVDNPDVWINKGDGYIYYSPERVKDMLRECVPKIKKNNPTFVVTEQGPALNHLIPQRHLSQDFMGESDFVFPVFACPKWPEVAKGWGSRDRPSGWPDAALVAEIVSEGCHVVPVPHPTSKEPELEWRMSFSKAELKIASKINRYQRQAYLLLKVIHSQVLKTPKAIVTYHLKTLFFWMLEIIPYDDWTADSLGPCLLRMIDCLYKCLKEGCIQSYFIPENNLIDRLSPEICESLACKVEKIRADPLRYLFDFNKEQKWYFGLFCKDAEEVFKCVLDDAAIDTIDEKRSGEVFVMLAWAYATYYLSEHGITLNKGLKSGEKVKRSTVLEYTIPYEIALDCIKDVARIRESYTNQSCDFLGLVCFCISRLGHHVECMIGFSEYVLRQFPVEGSQYELIIRSNLACHYHVDSLRCHDESLRADLSQQARYNFEKVLSNAKVTLAQRVDYAVFLDKNEEYERLIEVLAPVNNIEGGVDTSGNIYEKHEVETLDENMKNIASVQTAVEVSSTSLALYLLVKTYRHLQQDTNSVIDTFRKHCHALEVNNGKNIVAGNAYVLLVYAYIAIGLMDEAEAMRKTALSILGEEKCSFLREDLRETGTN